jgi:hypothetical protein
MPTYILNKKAQPGSGDHEIHNTTCSYLPNSENQIALGFHSDCHDAVAKAKNLHPEIKSKINGCYFCCNSCHTS